MRRCAWRGPGGREEPGGRQTADRLVFDDRFDSVAAPAQIVHELLRLGVGRNRNGEISVPSEAWFGAGRNGETADQREVGLALAQVATDPAERALEIRHPNRALTSMARPGESPSSAPGRSCSHSRRRSSISRSVAPGSPAAQVLTHQLHTNVKEFDGRMKHADRNVGRGHIHNCTVFAAYHRFSCLLHLTRVYAIRNPWRSAFRCEMPLCDEGRRSRSAEGGGEQGPRTDLMTTSTTDPDVDWAPIFPIVRQVRRRLSVRSLPSNRDCRVTAVRRQVDVVDSLTVQSMRRTTSRKRSTSFRSVASTRSTIAGSSLA